MALPPVATVVGFAAIATVGTGGGGVETPELLAHEIRLASAAEAKTISPARFSVV
jgi:hypothetical protein